MKLLCVAVRSAHCHQQNISVIMFHCASALGQNSICDAVWSTRSPQQQLPKQRDIKMHRLIEGFERFRSEEFPGRQGLFSQLAGGQKPRALFITCSDSRIDPNLLTQSEPGELFTLRNAGNLVPQYSDLDGGEAATIEYAMIGLKIPQIIVCGHSQCGAMGALLDPDAARNFPAVGRWLEHAAAARQIVEEDLGNTASPAQRALAAVYANVLVQMDHLKTHPTVSAALAEHKVEIHGWVYHFETGEVFTHEESTGRFVPLCESESQS